MIVYLDGENVVHQLVDVLRRLGKVGSREDILHLDLRTFLQTLLHADQLTIRYYTTSLRLVRTDPILEQRSREMMHWSERWNNSLVLQDIDIIKAGRLKVRDGDMCPKCGDKEAVFREKGVDVRLAVDLLVDVTNDKDLVIWSSDADLIPAIQVAKRQGARVKNIAHECLINWAVAKQSGEWQTYNDEQLIKLFKAKKHMGKKHGK